MKKETKLLLAKLEKRQQKQHHILGNIRHQIEEIKEKELLPDLKRKYEGKYWKYNNGYNNEERWWIYSYCIEVKGEHDFCVVTFESSPNGCEFKTHDRGSYLCQIQITKSEYTKAAKAFYKVTH